MPARTNTAMPMFQARPVQAGAIPQTPMPMQMPPGAPNFQRPGMPVMPGMQPRPQFGAMPQPAAPAPIQNALAARMGMAY